MKKSELSDKDEARFNFYRFNAAYFEAMYELAFDFILDYIEPLDINGSRDCADLIFGCEYIGGFIHEGVE